MSRRKIKFDFRWLLLFLLLAGAMAGGLYWCFYTGIITSDLKIVNDRKYDKQISAAARKHGIPVALLRAVIRRESRFRADMVGKKGEIGLMQVLPSGAAADWARVHKKKRPSDFELFDVKTNLEIGCWFLARALKRWKNYRYGTELALAEYNAGLTNARRWAPADRNARVIDRITFDSTREYVTVIMRYYRQELEKKTLR